MTQDPTTESLNLNQFSDAELQAELKKRREAEKQRIIEQREADAQFWTEKIDLILELIPEHSRTTCSDADPKNEHRCSRCYVLYAKQFQWDSDRELSITVNKLRDPFPLG
jgi:hypothetical protein